MQVTQLTPLTPLYTLVANIIGLSGLLGVFGWAFSNAEELCPRAAALLSKVKGRRAGGGGGGEGIGAALPPTEDTNVSATSLVAHTGIYVDLDSEEPPASKPTLLTPSGEAASLQAAPAALVAPLVPDPDAQPCARSPKPLAPRSLSPTWRGDAPAAELIVANLFQALQLGDERGVAALLARAPGLANAAKNGITPLHAAVRAKSLPLAQLLVRAGADARAVDGAGRTAAAAAEADGAAGLAAWLAATAARQ